MDVPQNEDAKQRAVDVAICAANSPTPRIIASGTTLPRVKSIFNLARMLQPSLIILEDVDLVFASREVNLYSSVLGDLLDQMDGLRPQEDVSVVLTTNSIERLEPAITNDDFQRAMQEMRNLAKDPQAGLSAFILRERWRDRG